jgi:uncharacterized glyoxalase superfamily protein PhnB
VPTPPDWPQLSSALFYEDAAAAIEWLEKAFGFDTRLRVEDGAGGIVHSELAYGAGLVMVATARAAEGFQSPRALGGANTQSLFLFVDDVDAHCARAREAGAHIFRELADQDYGEHQDRGYGALDPEGHRWWFGQRLAPKGPR